jgi:hypothetical protein
MRTANASNKNRSARRIARDNKQKTYISSTPCSRGHKGPRETLSANCIECKKTVTKTYQTKKEMKPMRVIVEHFEVLPYVEPSLKERLANLRFPNGSRAND